MLATSPASGYRVRVTLKGIARPMRQLERLKPHTGVPGLRTCLALGGLVSVIAACTPAPEDTCGAKDYLDAIGQPPGFVTLPTDRPVRILRPGEAMTLDYIPERLNVEVGSLGLVTALRCG